MKKKYIILLIVAIVLALIIGFIIYKNINKVEQDEDENFKIVTTFYPIYIMTANITQGAENVELVNMTETNVGCLHNYTLSTADMKKVENADVIIQNGLGLENFMDKILNTYSNINIVDSSENVTNIIEEDEEVNAHIWTSISNYISQVEKIASSLSQANPENASVYTANAEKYINKLEELQEQYSTELSNLHGQKAICLNEALTYLAEEIGLEVTSVETDHEESTLSAETMKNLINQINDENISIILVDSDDNMQSAETLANETGATIYVLKSGLTGSMEANAYIEIMNENLETLKTIED